MVGHSGLRLQENKDVHEHYWEQLAGRDRNEIALRAGCTYTAESDCLAILLLNRLYQVDLANGTIRPATETTERTEAGFIEQLCILAYLVHAKDLPRTGRLVRAEKLDAGGFFFRGSHRLPVEKLEKAFGSDPQQLHQAGRMLKALPQAFGDAAIEISVLPRIPLTIIIWAADEEFPARASILFDQSVAEQLPLDVLYAAAKLTIATVVSSCK